MFYRYMHFEYYQTFNTMNYILASFQKSFLNTFLIMQSEKH